MSKHKIVSIAVGNAFDIENGTGDSRDELYVLTNHGEIYTGDFHYNYALKEREFLWDSKPLPPLPLEVEDE